MAKLLTLVFFISLTAFSVASNVAAQTTAFTYQGSLKDGAGAANGNYDFEFKLFDLVSAGAQQGSTLQRLNLAVADGIFTVSLDFGAGTLPGADRFLDIAVRTAGGGAFTALSPRQKVNSAPYSVRSLNSTTATNATQLGGVAAAGYLQVTGGTITGNLAVNGTISGNGSGLTNLNLALVNTIVTTTVSVAGGSFASVVATCPSGLSATGGGYELSDSVGSLINIMQSRPLLSGTGWVVRARSTAASAASVIAYAVCVQLN